MKAFHPVTSGEIMISKEQPMNKFYNWLIRQNQNNFNNNKKNSMNNTGGRSMRCINEHAGFSNCLKPWPFQFSASGFRSAV